MRDIPGLNQRIVDRATALAGQAPAFRFRGATPPDPAARVPVSYASPVKVKDGVAKLRLYDVIDSWGGPWGISANEFVDALDELEDSVTEIRLHINSPGGEVWEGLAIMNALRQHDAPVVAVVDGIAASAASFIACACDEVVMGGNTRMMIHDALGISVGQAKDMREFADFLDDVSNNIASVYAAKTGGSTDEWRATMLEHGLAGTWYSAEEAVAAGLADRVDGSESTEEPEGQPSDRWDLSVFGRVTDPLPAAAPVTPAAAAAGLERAEDEKRHMARMRTELDRKKPSGL